MAAARLIYSFDTILISPVMCRVDIFHEQKHRQIFLSAPFRRLHKLTNVTKRDVNRPENRAVSNNSTVQLSFHNSKIPRPFLNGGDLKQLTETRKAISNPADQKWIRDLATVSNQKIGLKKLTRRYLFRNE